MLSSHEHEHEHEHEKTTPGLNFDERGRLNNFFFFAQIFPRA